jgi:hypothetical protein
MLRTLLQTTHDRARRVRRFVSGLALAGATLGFSALGCGLLDTTDPDIVIPPNLDGPEALPTVLASAIGDFSLAYSGSGADGSGGVEGIIMYSGLLGDEWINSETFPTRIEVDRRNIQNTNGTLETWFRTLSRARRSADVAADKYREFAPDTTVEAGLPETLALSGFSYLFFAENYCSGIPFSTPNPDGTFVYGNPLTTALILDSALSKFNQALAAATALQAPTAATTQTKNSRINLARVGRARVFLDRGDFVNAAAAVSTAPAVPDTFGYLIFHDENTDRQNNGVFRANSVFERYSIADREGAFAAASCDSATACLGNGPGLPYRSDADPRIRFTRTGAAGGPGGDVGFDRRTPQFDEQRYLDRRASVPLATGLEARLIEAENALNTGGLGAGSGYLAFHNALRQTPPSYILGAGAAIPPMAVLTDPGTPAARIDQHFKERAYWLWATGHRLSDMRRLIRPLVRGGYGRAENTVFPTGAYFKQSLQYDGTAVNFPVPFDEENNPNFDQCLDRLP